jgi:putative spermidine/putrescine transport system permease protein
MANTTEASANEPLRSASGELLKTSLRRSLRRQRLQAVGLVAPLFLFILFTFMLPIGDMLFRSVENEIVPDVLHRTVAALESWNPEEQSLPGEDVYAAMVADLKEARENRTASRVGQRLNYEHSGMSSLFRSSARKARRIDEPPYKDALIDANKDWGSPNTWKVIKTFSGNYTAGYFAAAVDAQVTPDGSVEMMPENERVYLPLFWRTLLLSAFITFMTFLLGFPIAHLLATVPTRISNLLIIMVLLPFWTSLLVRTTSWIALLQKEGVINDFLVGLGVIGDGSRLTMIHNATGTVVAMTHILLPFMVLPLYSVMKTISPNYVRAAKSLGATPSRAFWRIYFPQTIPGIGAGAILVFILAIGYYITPELVGGTSGTFISNRIAYNISTSLNWGLAAALGILLLAIVMALYILYDKIVGIDNMKLG